MSMSGSYLCTAESDDVDELVASMTTDLIYWQSLRNSENRETRCNLIYKVLQCIRASDAIAYEPTVLSIGPYHHGLPSLFPMDKEKWLCLDYVLKLNCNRNLHDYLAVVAELEREVRMCYSEDNIISSRTFVEMILLDSCFILVCLNGIGGVKMQVGAPEEWPYGQHERTEILVVERNEASILHEKEKETMVENIPTPSCRTKDDIAYQMEQEQVDPYREIKQSYSVETDCNQNKESNGQVEQWYNSSAVYDLLLLENQIPFFIVTKIFELLIDGDSTAQRLLSENLCIFIEGILLHFPIAIQDANRPNNFDHLLHLCYMYFKPSCDRQHMHQMKKRTGYFQTLLFGAYKYFDGNFNSQENEENPLSQAPSEDMHSVKEFQRWRRAEQYHDAGVEFRNREFDEHNPHSLLDIQFIDGVLHIPCLPVDDKCATLFRNLLAFEQSCPTLGNDMASYIHFLCHLISVPDDVALLSRKGVIVHQLDSDEEVSTLFARLLEYTVFDFSDEHYLKSLSQVMEEHYQNRLNRWISWLWHNHFANPWLGFAAFASVVLVICTVAQTILAFLSYWNVS